VNDAELTELERRLQQRLALEPPAALRGEVTKRVARELRSSSIDWWTYLGLAAAVAVLWANLSWTVCRNLEFAERADPPDSALVAELRHLLPEWSERGAAHGLQPANPTSPESRKR
jgi:hypothetical protein